MEQEPTQAQVSNRELYLKSLTSEGRRMFKIRDLLDMTPRFQRSRKPEQVKKIAAEFRPHRFDDPVVCICSDGTHLLDDGQHRVAAAAVLMGEDAEVLCRIAYTDEPGEEFVRLNSDRRGVSAYAKFNALRYDENSAVAELDELARQFGFVIGNGSGVHTINCVSTLSDLYRKDPLALQRSLKIIRRVIEVRGDRERGWLRQPVIQGIWYLVRYVDFDADRLVNALKRQTPFTAVIHSTNEGSAPARDLVEVYNKGLRAERHIALPAKTRAQE